MVTSRRQHLFRRNEMALLAMLGVCDRAIFGIPDEEFGEKLCATSNPIPRRCSRPPRS